MITVIDYKAGNLTSVLKALRYLGAEVDGDGSEPEMLLRREQGDSAGSGPFRGDATAG